ncbi:MAG: hypothetical protein GXP54_10705 [Deltaproteobacteria bacterium]|nr:hypothetical protein [Deltaproteobacteria bacterium]
MKSTCLYAVIFLAPIVMSCKPKIPPATGDETRSAAVEMVPGITTDDKVSAKWDAVDWKRFNVDSPTPATVNVYWDDSSVGAKITLRDMFGGAVAEVDHAEGAKKDSLSGISLKQGTYFLEIEATSGASVYTVELFLGDPNAGGSYGVPRPE